VFRDQAAEGPEFSARLNTTGDDVFLGQIPEVNFLGGRDAVKIFQCPDVLRDQFSAIKEATVVSELSSSRSKLVSTGHHLPERCRVVATRILHTSGFSLGEKAGTNVMENARSAQRRGTKPDRLCDPHSNENSTCYNCRQIIPIPIEFHKEQDEQVVNTEVDQWRCQYMNAPFT
jgi:hypothetical protein